MGAFCPSKEMKVTNWQVPISYQDAREEFDDDTMDFSVKSILQDSTSYTSSLCQIVKFRIGNQLMCMSWNLWHDNQSTPFDYYWNIWSLKLSDWDRALIDTL